MQTLLYLLLAGWLLALITTVANLLFVPRLRPQPPRVFPLVSVIIPARNEERTIGRAVSALLAQTYPSLEIVVVDDRSTDATGAILAAIDDPRLVVVHNEELPEGWLGKPWALHQGSLRARGEWLLLIDADVVYEPDAVAAAVTYAEESAVEMLSLFPHFEMKGFWEHIGMPNLPMTGFVLNPLWLGNRTRIPLLAIGGGPGNLIRRGAYDAVGGHEAMRDAIIDDIGIARVLRRRGYRTAMVRADDLVSIRMYHGLREIIDGFTKNAFAIFQGSYLAAVLGLVISVAISLFPYAMAFTGNPVAIAIVATITIIRVVLFHSFRYRLDNALFGHPLMALVWIYIMGRSLWYTGIRRQVQWRGRTYGRGKGERPRWMP